MDCTARTLRITPLDAFWHRIDHEPLVLEGDIRIWTEPIVKSEIEADGITMASVYPERWTALRIEIEGLLEAQTDLDPLLVITALGRTEHVAIEAWGAAEDGAWPYVVAPWADTGAKGLHVSGNVRGRKEAHISCKLFEEDPTPGDNPFRVTGRQELFAPQIPAQRSQLLTAGVTDQAPPTATPIAVQRQIREADIAWQQRAYGQYA